MKYYTYNEVVEEELISWREKRSSFLHTPLPLTKLAFKFCSTSLIEFFFACTFVTYLLKYIPNRERVGMSRSSLGKERRDEAQSKKEKDTTHMEQPQYLASHNKENYVFAVNQLINHLFLIIHNKCVLETKITYQHAIGVTLKRILCFSGVCLL